MTYLLLNAVFLVLPVALLVAALVVAKRRGRGRAPIGAAIGLALAVVLVLTAVFDNVLIGLGIFYYAEDRISGLRIGLAPVEDFAYAVAAAIALPSLWVLLRRARA
ncbi:lycopene cyclase domain-containing protein [Naasia sp. SYSU D00948]|uniref:lycopene cyclase domain-containing protein n=1 Tax=Naasia sp. SYSU D00948 TaxID=2817379 RepID=UPI001B3039A3|nr:lycopene cyclase domain-containing protein [Naasia sp. SYSU D00948]